MQPIIRLVVLAMLVVAGCKQKQSNTAPPASPPAKAATDDQCKADADCPGGSICEARIVAACETCDGGPVVRQCVAPAACADDTNCTSPRTCKTVDCPTCETKKAQGCF